MAAYIDIKEHIIPDWINGWIFAMGTVMLFTGGEVAFDERLLGCVTIPLLMIGINVILKGAFGGGDIKLIAACGWFFGAKVITYGAFLGIGLSGIYGMILVVAAKKSLQEKFALGPFLVVGILVAAAG